MKNKFIKSLSLLMAVIAVIFMFGCGKNDSGETGTTKSNGKLIQPSVNNSTAVINYTSMNDENKEVNATNIITGIDENTINYISTGSKLNQSLKTEDDKKDFVNEAEDKYGIPSDEAQEIVKNPEKWAAFSYIAFVSNTNAKCMKFRQLECESSQNIKISKELDCEYGLDPGKAMVIAIDGLVNVTELPTIEEITQELSTMKINVKCVLVNGSCVSGTADEVSNWETAKYSLMPITVEAVNTAKTK
ncbi:MAG: hypothetical protein PUB20_08335 [Clostridia bacterium]|nr:hypothetical protein [Clostridia bacterium]